MPYIQLNEKQFPLRIGETSVGTIGADIPVDGPQALGVQAKIQVGSDNSVVIRRASSEAVVRVNGVQLGAEPTPLIHGDKIDIASAELLYGDDRKGGQTQHLTGLRIPEGAETYAPSTVKPTAGTGGRLVSLVDGREYNVTTTGLSIGRDAGCDVVVPSPEVSRKHAELVPGTGGYTVSDLSTNGVFVNGQRVQGAHTLSRGDVLRIGTEEFRFYADVVPAGAAGAPPAPAVVPPPAPPPVAAPVAVTAPPAAATPKAMPVAIPAAPHAPAPATGASAAAPQNHTDSRPVLATLELMNEGPSKGTRYEIRVPLTHVGRGAHNDVVLADDSVSDSHAKLQKRENGWFVVDIGSTNGTWCGGQRITGEAPITGVTSLRFGGIRVSFVPADVDDTRPAEDASGTRVIRGLSVEQARKMSREMAKAPVEDTPPRSGVPVWVWVFVLALLGAGALFILKVR